VFALLFQWYSVADGTSGGDLMPDESVIDRPTTVGGGGRSTRRGGGSFGRQNSGSSSGTPAGDDFDRLAAMLERIGKSLERLIKLSPPILPSNLQSEFLGIWPEAQSELNLAVGRLRRDRPLTRPSAARAQQQLERAGLAGPMLKMKEKSLYYHLDPLDAEITTYQAATTTKPILTLPEDEGLFKRLLFLVKPATKVMNSIVGSIPAAIFPGKEIFKEVKEHVEAGYEAVQLSREA